jgi:hypothetical protein
MYIIVCLYVLGVLRLGEGTPSYDSEMEVDERLPWEHITGVYSAIALANNGMCCGSTLQVCARQLQLQRKMV